MKNLSTSFYLSLLILISLSSCHQKIYIQDAYSSERTEVIDNSEIDIDVRYGGDALDYLVFQVDIRNNSEEALYVEYKDMALYIIDHYGEKGERLKALNPNFVTDDLLYEKENVKREKKARNISNGINVGLGVLLAVASPNTSSGIDNIGYALDATAYMIEDNRAYNLINGSIEEQIQYIEEWVLNEATILPNEEGTWDILFERTLMSTPVDFTVKNEYVNQSFPFNFEVREEKIRR